MSEFSDVVRHALLAPFPDDEVEWLPRAASGARALALPYIDARSVMRRLDAVVGPANWSFDFDMLAPDGKLVRGRLTVLGVTKCDAGEASTEDEILKSAVSDALKRCAVHFGIGRYLYYLPRVWAPYDSQKRQFTEAPRISDAAVDRALEICGYRVSAASGAPQPPPAAEAPAGSPPRPAAAAPPPVDQVLPDHVCHAPGCGAALTPAQVTLSRRLCGGSYCATHQKGRERPGEPARAKTPPRVRPSDRPV